MKLVFMMLLSLILLLSIALPAVCASLTAAAVPLKVIASIVSVSLVGFFMGMPFPLGLSLADKEQNAPLIIYWGVNGFTSMSGSVLATIFLINTGFHCTMIMAIVFYGLAFLTLMMQLKKIA